LIDQELAPTKQMDHPSAGNNGKERRGGGAEREREEGRDVLWELSLDPSDVFFANLSGREVLDDLGGRLWVEGHEHESRSKSI
jgi:hypothetical protein